MGTQTRSSPGRAAASVQPSGRERPPQRRPHQDPGTLPAPGAAPPARLRLTAGPAPSVSSSLPSRARPAPRAASRPIPSTDPAGSAVRRGGAGRAGPFPRAAPPHVPPHARSARSPLPGLSPFLPPHARPPAPHEAPHCPQSGRGAEGESARGTKEKQSFFFFFFPFFSPFSPCAALEMQRNEGDGLHASCQPRTASSAHPEPWESRGFGRVRLGGSWERENARRASRFLRPFILYPMK